MYFDQLEFYNQLVEFLTQDKLKEQDYGFYFRNENKMKDLPINLSITL